MPRRARHLIPTQLPRRGEAIAACALLVVFAHLLFAQLTLVLAVALAVVGKATRWRRLWLAAPAAAGLVWMLAIGPRAAFAGFTAGPAQVASYLASVHSLSQLLHPHEAFAGAGDWLPRQLPVALVVASAEAALAGWLDWVHTDEWAVRSPRPGALAAARSAANRRAIRAGAIVTRDGGVLGVSPATGARVALGWPEAVGGVLVTGAAADVVTITSFQLVHAALRRRKPVIAVDMTGETAVAHAMATVCAAAGVQLRVFAGAEGHYEPFRRASPARRLAMTLALLGVADTVSVTGQSAAPLLRTYLRAVYELMDAVPADPRTPVLDDVRHLLNPLALQARFALVPATGPRPGQLSVLVRAAMGAAQADPRALLTAAGQLAAVRWTPTAGRAADGGIDLARAVRERSAVLFRVAAGGLARLVLADLAAVAADLRRIGVDGDGLVWLHGWEGDAACPLGGLVADGAAAGLPVLVSATAPAAADIAGKLNAVLVHRLDDSAAAASLAARTGTRMAPANTAATTAAPATAVTTAATAATTTAATTLATPPGPAELVPRPAVPAQALLSLAPGQFVLTVNSPRYRLVHPAQLVPARLPPGAAR